MKLRISFCLLILTATSVLSDHTTPPLGLRDKTPDIRAFTNVLIIVAPGDTISNGTIVISDGRITDVGTGISIPDGATVSNLSGFSVYPGFIDPYTDYGMPKREAAKRSYRDKPKYAADRIGGSAHNEAFHAAENWVDQFRPDSKSSDEMTALGFTTARTCRLDGIFRGRSCIVQLGKGLPNDLILSPHSYHVASFDKGASPMSNPSSLMGSIALIRQAFLDAKWYVGARAAYALNPDQPMPEFNTTIDALATISDEPVLFETDDELSLLRANRIATEFGFRFIHIGSGYEYARIDEIASTGATIILPVNYPKTPDITNQNDELDVTLAKLRHWERAPSNASVLEQHDIEFAFTTVRLKDKSAFKNNVHKAVERGLSRDGALAALTTVPARLCGVSQLVGSVERGKLANFVLTDGDIFDDSTAVFSVFVGGVEHEFIDRSALAFKGRYDLSIAGSSYNLSVLLESPSRPSIQLKADTSALSTKSVSIRQGRLYFTASLDTADTKALTRFSGVLVNDTIKGTATLPDGATEAWIAGSNDADDSETPDENSDKPDTKDFPLVSRLTWPNKAFGFEKLPQREDLLIRNATIWTSESDGILKSYDLLIRSGKFAQLGKNLEAPKGARVYDASGKHITAGIIDAHSHIAISKGVNEGTDAVTAEVRISDVINSDDLSIYRQLTGGVTTSHILHGSANPIGGQLQLIKLRWGAPPEELKLKGAPPTIKFALGENVKQSNWGDNYRSRYPQTRMGVETIMKDEFQTAREYERKWEAYRSLSKKERRRTIPPRHDLELDAILDILNSKLFIHCHSYHQTEILMLMRLAEQFGFTVQTFTHILEGYKVAGEMARHGATASSFADWWAYKFEVYDAIPYNVALMTRKGVLSSINSDSDDLGRRLNLEAAKSVQYGDMSQEEAIKLATINPAIQLKVDDRIGSIEVGKDADFVIWNGNPLSIYSSVEQTWIEGKKYFDIDRDLQTRLQIREEKNALIQKALASSKKGKKSPGKMGQNKPEEKHYKCDDIQDIWRLQHAIH
ncbi:MAG: amidohydrolase family protein [Candidatus Zixiibacteriota bacterium]